MAQAVSIIIPNLNSPLVGRTITALKAQGAGPPAEIIVVGLDGPGLIKEDEQVRFISTGRPVGPATARNIGLGRAKGECLFFIDADCIPAADWLAQLLPYLEQEVCAVGGAVAFGRENLWALADNLASFHEYLPSRKAGPRPYLPTINLGVRREAVAAVGGFDESLPTAEDLDFTVRLYRRGYRLYFIPSAVVHHAPGRRSLGALLSHAFTSGGNSVRVRWRYPEVFGMPAFARRPLWLALAAPAVAAQVVLKMCWEDREVLKYWPALPLVYLAKLAWCAGAVRALGAFNA